MNKHLVYERMYDTEFASYISDMYCSQIIVVLQQCYSGGFIEELQSLNNSADLQVYTAAGTGPGNIGTAYAEEWLTNNLYGEFTFYWCAAVRGYYPDFEYPWTTDIITGQFNFEPVHGNDHDGDFDPDLNGDDVVSMEEAFHYARHMDTWADYGEYIPFLYGHQETPMDEDGRCSNCQTLTGYMGHVDEKVEIFNKDKALRISGNLFIENEFISQGTDATISFATDEASLQVNDILQYLNPCRVPFI